MTQTCVSPWNSNSFCLKRGLNLSSKFNSKLRWKVKITDISGKAYQPHIQFLEQLHLFLSEWLYPEHRTFTNCLVRVLWRYVIDMVSFSINGYSNLKNKKVGSAPFKRCFIDLYLLSKNLSMSATPFMELNRPTNSLPLNSESSILMIRLLRIIAMPEVQRQHKRLNHQMGLKLIGAQPKLVLIQIAQEGQVGDLQPRRHQSAFLYLKIGINNNNCSNNSLDLHCGYILKAQVTQLMQRGT